MQKNSGTSNLHTELLEDWDPLSLKDEVEDPGLLIAARKREIKNILKSYTGYYDLFAELLQNALDAVERRASESSNYEPKIWVHINMQDFSISITDNGCGMSLQQFRQFLRPNFSFKDGTTTRGNKGVGATYLAYGFNHLEVATKYENKVYCGLLKNGRQWLEDKTETIARPVVTKCEASHDAFYSVDCGTSMTLKLVGANIRPKNLEYVGATTAGQWMKILQVVTPIGGIYLCSEKAPNVQINLKVTHPKTGESSTETVDFPKYVFPHEVMGKSADLREFLEEQRKRSERGLDISRPPVKYTKLNGLWGEWSGEEIVQGLSPIKPKLSLQEEELIKELGIKMYVFLGFSTDLWDDFNDKTLNLRKGYRILRGGLQLATRNMPQGNPITIPLTNNIGFQNIAHVIVHFDNAEPDLGRKGFQPEVVTIAEKISVSAVTAFRKHYPRLLRKQTGSPALQKQMQLDQWIEQQKEHEKIYPLIIKGKGLFMPTEELPIRSAPIVEQDVVALFNQMLSSGLIRGIQVLSTSQYKQYDGLYRIYMDPPFDKYIRSEDNPLGIESDVLVGTNEPLISKIQVLEYKHKIDYLLEEFSVGEKSPDDIGLVVAWEMGLKWKGSGFEVISYLNNENAHLREFHGFTHSFRHFDTGTHAFEVILLKDLIQYLLKPIEESDRQLKEYCEI